MDNEESEANRGRLWTEAEFRRLGPEQPDNFDWSEDFDTFVHTCKAWFEDKSVSIKISRRNLEDAPATEEIKHKISSQISAALKNR